MAKSLKKSPPSIVKEAAVHYNVRSALRSAPSSTLQKVTELQSKSRLSAGKNSKAAEQENFSSRWLGGAALIGYAIHSDFDLLQAGTEGISKASVDELASHLGISRKSMAEDVFDLSVKTLERKAPTDKLDKKTSSHALEIAKVVQHAYEVFEDEEKVKRWVSKENRALNGLKPLQLFATLTGLVMVNDVLGRIEEGVYS